MSVLRIDRVTTREAADRWHEVEAACSDADYVTMPADPVQAVYARIENTRSDEHHELWLGSCGDHAVAIGSLNLPMLDNLTAAYVDVRVHPAFRRRGHARSMLGQVIERATARGRNRLIADVCEPVAVGEPAEPQQSAGQLFAAAAGAKPVTSEIRRMLTINDLDEDHLSSLRADAIAHSTGYSLVQWVGAAADELVDDLAALMARMSTDAPFEDLDWEPEQWTAGRYREQERSIIAAGRVRLTTAARHEASGQIVACTHLATADAQPEFASQWSTIVIGEHRGHRLGMLIKLANLHLLRTRRPRVRFINTWNAAVNGHMVGINEAMGFRAVERWREWQLDVGDATATAAAARRLTT
jgi:GNAT superfamily N-acetyltransferase